MKKHYLPGDIVSPRGPVVIALIGCGGTGSSILTDLVRLNYGLRALSHPGIDVTVYDPDRVSAANIGRQNFSPHDVGRHKAVAMVTRINQFTGFCWSAVPARFEMVESHGKTHNIIITAVDSAKARLNIANNIRQKLRRCCYWCDVGNTKDTGQVILGTLGEIPQPKKSDAVECLPTVDILYDLKKVREKDQGPSCSLRAAIQQQDLMVNRVMSAWTVQLLWSAFRNGYITYHGCFCDLKTLKTNPLPVDPTVWERMAKSC